MCAYQLTRRFKLRLIMILLQRDFPGVEPRPKLPHPETPQNLPPSRKRHRSPPSSTFEYSPRSSGLRSWSGNYKYSRAPPSSYAIHPVSPLYKPSPDKYGRTWTTTGANTLPVRPKDPDNIIVQVCAVRDYDVHSIVDWRPPPSRTRNPTRSRGASLITSKRWLPRITLRPLHRSSSPSPLVLAKRVQNRSTP